MQCTCADVCAYDVISLKGHGAFQAPCMPHALSQDFCVSMQAGIVTSLRESHPPSLRALDSSINAKVCTPAGHTELVFSNAQCIINMPTTWWEVLCIPPMFWVGRWRPGRCPFSTHISGHSLPKLAAHLVKAGSNVRNLRCSAHGHMLTVTIRPWQFSKLNCLEIFTAQRLRELPLICNKRSTDIACLLSLPLCP